MIKTADKLTFYGGSSMWPTLLPADRLILEECDAKALRPGEIVVYQGRARLAVHRVLAVVAKDGQTWVRTCADNSRTPDPEWPADRLVGRVTEILPVKGKPRKQSPAPFYAWRMRHRLSLRHVFRILRRRLLRSSKR